MALTMFNLMRVVVMIFGGAVVGGGTVVLIERGRFYARLGLPHAVRAMHALTVVNMAVLLYVGITLAEKWDDWLTWRLPAAVVIFVCKAYFFHMLRSTGLEQERRILFNSE